MPEPHCRICLQPLAGELHYHANCCRALFGGTNIPVLPFRWDDLNSMAESVVRSQIAMPGVQPKLSLHLEHGGSKEGERFTLVGLEGGYILKPPVTSYPEMPEVEHLTMRMARAIGIETAECGLMALEDEKLALIVRRMDRIGTAKLQMEDFAQLSDRLTSEKYRGSLESAGKVILRYSSNPGFDALRFFEVNLFCFLTGNADMHLKNFSLLRKADGEIGLSPAYDLLATRLLLPQDREETALTLNGKKSNLRPKDFKILGKALQLSDRQMENTLKRLRSRLDQATLLIDQSFCSSGLRESYHALIRERCAKLEW